MKIYPSLLKASLAFLLSVSLPALATEEITNFNIQIQVNADGSLRITELLEVYAEGNRIKHGIVRDIINVVKDEDGKIITYPIKIISVRKGGHPEPFNEEDLSGYLRVKIGDPTKLLEPGVYAYEVTYVMPDQIRFFEGYDELYFNAIGTGWEFGIKASEVEIILPQDGKIIQYAAYSGKYSSTTCKCEITNPEKNRVIVTTGKLQPFEGLTAAVGFDKGLIRKPEKPVTDNFFDFTVDKGIVFKILLYGCIVITLFYLIGWVIAGRDPAKGIIIPQFAPPNNLSPALCRSLLKMGFDDRAFISSLINLATKGFIRIEKNTKGFNLIRLVNSSGDLVSDEKVLFEKLLGNNDTFEINKSGYNRLIRVQKEHQEVLQKETSKTHFNTNQHWWAPGVFLSVLTIISAYIATFFVELYTFLVLTGCGIIAAVLIPLIIKIYPFLRKGNLRQRITASIFATGLLFVIYYGLNEFEGPEFYDDVIYFFGTMVAVLAGINILFAYLLKAPTQGGRKIMDLIEGFKMYLATAEKERLEILHGPELTTDYFEQMLPYAIAFGVEKNWSARFENILINSQTIENYRPDWYGDEDFGNFNFNRFTKSVSDEFASAIYIACHSSSDRDREGISSSDSSGSSGGGFAGGGSGGGGGGGW